MFKKAEKFECLECGCNYFISDFVVTGCPECGTIDKKIWRESRNIQISAVMVLGIIEYFFILDPIMKFLTNIEFLHDLVGENNSNIYSKIKFLLLFFCSGAVFLACQYLVILSILVSNFITNIIFLNSRETKLSHLFFNVSVIMFMLLLTLIVAVLMVGWIFINNPLFIFTGL